MSQEVPAIKFRRLSSAEITASNPTNLRVIWSPSGTVTMVTYDPATGTEEASRVVTEIDIQGAFNNQARYIKRITAISGTYIWVGE